MEGASSTPGSPLTLDRQENHWLIRGEGDICIASAGQLKALLLEGLVSGKELRVDLERAGEMDITALQLLWAAGREAGTGGLIYCLSEPVANAARDAGFEPFPGGVAEK